MKDFVGLDKTPLVITVPIISCPGKRDKCPSILTQMDGLYF
jgi:hypothetical protein